MNVDTAYEKFQIKVNNNSETGKIGIDRARFVITFNESSNKLIEYTLDKKNEDDIRYIQKILVSDYPISSSESKEDYQKFKLPENYFDFSSAYAKATKNACQNKKIDLFEIKDDDKGLILQDENNNPSFEAREAPFHITSDSVKAYKKDFVYTSLFLSYYRYPVQIKLIDENNPESGFDTNFNPEFDNKFVDRIISLASGEFELNNESQKSQADKIRAQSKI
jgi:hypothetical protein